MHEVEAKIHLTKEEFDQLRQSLNQRRGVAYRGQFKKLDTYYHTPVPNLTLRIRKMSGKNQFQIKYRSTKEGIEANKEWEWSLGRPLAFKTLLKKAEIHPYITKEKRTDLFVWKKMNIELNWVKSLGYFLEIETLVKVEKKIPKAMGELKRIFKELGFEEKKFEKRQYLELINQST